MGKRRIKVTRVRHRRLAPQRVWLPTLLDEAFVEMLVALNVEAANVKALVNCAPAHSSVQASSLQVR